MKDSELRGARGGGKLMHPIEEPGISFPGWPGIHPTLATVLA